MALGADLERAWSHPAATAATRKRILRAALTEIIVRREGANHPCGPALAGRRPYRVASEAALNAVGPESLAFPTTQSKLVRELARLMPDRQIARLLNRTGKSRPDTAMPGRKSGVRRSAITTTSPSSATANGRSEVRSRSKRQRKLIGVSK